MAISEGEVAVYDRQLRLWGVQAQQRLLKARVLIWGLDGNAVEVAKNLVLAGVSLVIRDHRLADQAAMSFNYFLRPEDIGKSRAESAAQRIQEMNPLCSVSALTSTPQEAKLHEELKDFDFVLVGPAVLAWDMKLFRDVSSVCRELRVCFAMTAACGEIAFFFSDLGEHTVQEYSSAQGAGPGEETKKKEPETVSFPSFLDWLACKPSDMQRSVDGSILLFALFFAFLSEGGGEPKPEAATKFQDFCRDVAKCTVKIDGIEELKDAYHLFFMEPLIHVASIVAGLLSQEVIKAITKRDLPLLNCVCFNANTGCALVERLPPAQSKPKKRKVEEVADILD